MRSEEKRLWPRRVRITEVNVDASPFPMALATDDSGGQLVIDLSRGPAGWFVVPEVGQTWWVERTTTRWTLSHMDNEWIPKGVEFYFPPHEHPAHEHLQYPKFLGRDIVLNASAWNNGSVAVYVAWSNGDLAVSVTKQRTDTRLLVHYGYSMYITAGLNNGWHQAIDIAGTQYDQMKKFDNELSSHADYTGQALIAGLAAGAYTLTLGLKASGTTPVLNTDANDSGWMEVWEVPS